MKPRLGAALLVEFVGTFALVFIGMFVFNYGKDPLLVGKIGLLVIAPGHGLILGTMITAAMPTSGGHLNPAVTLGFIATGKIKPGDGIAYIVVQLLAGTVAALTLFIVYGGDMEAGKAVITGATDYDKVNPGIAVLVEAIATFFLAFAVWGTAVDPRARNVGGFAVGLTVAADILAFGPVTNASMNPARSFGPTLVASLVPQDPGSISLWGHQWVYWVGPVLGGVVAALLYHAILMPKAQK